MTSRLEELFEKVRKRPQEMTKEEALELQDLARRDKATIGQKTARATRKAGKPLKSLTLEDIQKMIAEQGKQTGESGT